MLKLIILTQEITDEFVIRQGINKKLLYDVNFLLIKDEERSIIFRVSDMNERHIFCEIVDLCIKFKITTINSLKERIQRIMYTQDTKENIARKLLRLTKNTDFSFDTLDINKSSNNDSIMLEMQI